MRAQRQLRRQIDTRTATALVVGEVIAVGIFLLLPIVLSRLVRRFGWW